MNRICIVGRLMVEPELRTVGEKLVAKGALSVSQNSKPKEGEQYPPSDVFNFEVWGARGESLVNHARKGSHLWVTGSMQSRKDNEGRIWWTVVFADWGFAGAKPAERTAAPDDDYGGF